MIKLKAVALMICIVGALTASVVFMAQGTSRLPIQHIETANARMQDILQEKLVNAEESLTIQADDLATDEKFVAELSSVREKLLSTTPAELKKQTRNTWNNGVFERLTDWRSMRGSSVNQHKASMDDIMRSESGSMTLQFPVANWWGKSPDLVLAFAAVPLKTGETSATLIANGTKGKELQGGKRYDQEVHALAEAISTQKDILGHFAWDGKMYMAVVAPVRHEGIIIGSVVVGIELSREGLTSIERALPKYTNLMLVYATPNLKEKGRRIIYASSDEARTTLESGRYHVNADEQDDKLIAYDEIQPNIVYTTTNDDGKFIAISRAPWVWDKNQESSLYFMTDLSNANQKNDALRRNVIIAGLIAMFAGIILILMLIDSMNKQTARIRKGIAEAIASGDPIDSGILTSLMGENADDLGQYAIRRVDAEDSDGEPESWNDMMMDFDDEANNKSDRSMSQEEIDELKEKPIHEDAEKLYKEYMRLRKENGITAEMSYDVFLRRLQRNAAKIKKAHDCESVSFEIHVSGGNVLLKPKIVKKA